MTLMLLQVIVLTRKVTKIVERYVENLSLNAFLIAMMSAGILVAGPMQTKENIVAIIALNRAGRN